MPPQPRERPGGVADLRKQDDVTEHRTDRVSPGNDPTGHLEYGGECARCKEMVSERITVSLIERSAGPGVSVYGCLPCARVMVARGSAPEWLAGDLAEIDAARARSAYLRVVSDPPA